MTSLVFYLSIVVRGTHWKHKGLPVALSYLSVFLLVVIRIFSTVSGSDESESKAQRFELDAS